MSNVTTVKTITVKEITQGEGKIGEMVLTSAGDVTWRDVINVINYLKQLVEENCGPGSADKEVQS